MKKKRTNYKLTGKNLRIDPSVLNEHEYFLAIGESGNMQALILTTKEMLDLKVWLERELKPKIVE